MRATIACQLTPQRKVKTMCGLFGAIGPAINPGIIRALAIANRDRGPESLGLLNSEGKMHKRAGDPVDLLGTDGFADFIDGACKGWFLCGHTRYSTTGSVNDKNAHPFRYGRFVGMHNGVVEYPRKKKYKVDSQYLIDQLNRKNGDYQTALEKVSGYWVLVWFDGDALYVQAHKNTVAIGCDETGTYYFSSREEHLRAAVRIVGKVRIIANGETVKFTVANPAPEQLPAFVSAVPEKDYSRYRSITNGSVSGGSSITATTSMFRLPECYAGKPGKRSEEREVYQKFAERDAVADKWDDPFCRDLDAKNEWLNGWDEYTKEYE